MTRGLQAFALRATLLAIYTGVTSALVVPRQSEQVHIGEGSFGPSSPDLDLSDNGEDIDELLDCQHIANKSAQSYILLGAIDSGTNLLHQLMYAAWPSKVCMESCGVVWKHTLTGADDMYRFLLTHRDRHVLRNTVVLHTLRSPISQFASWKGNPYDLRECVSRDVASWDQPCSARMGPRHAADDDPDQQPTVYNSTMDVYQQYLRQLEELREAGWFKAVMPVAYEDMLLSPKEILTEIAKHFEGLEEVQKADVEAAMQQPAKYPSDSLDDELHRLATRSYLHEFYKGDLKTLCKGLNRTLVEQYRAGNFLKRSRQVSYWDDCAHV